MKITPSDIADVLIIEPQVFRDERGFFYESFNERRFEELTGLQPRFVQDNHSQSVRNVVRGLHYQVGQAAQGKLIRVVAGTIFDVVVDLRRGSPSFGRAACIELSADNQRQLWIPPGFAHGFLVTSERADCIYKTTGYWSPADERTLLWNDPALAIDWPLRGAPIVSAKDQAGTPLAQAEVFS
ncbi:dTDP-4-dehydrorhamnose 3,5-epimerase [Massilia solisilvae]|uniref:dTDP-4-dehydrorhamnose 3,5-epimerase n=1 Tax=Massilia solisilvae TaxID=1811225 RepID=A0ABT2BDK2_9BURK|nr:dTDP-4-dehydrorhamnose 3,5-epimerase [Massilia solisilvae]MCS0606612.1 dTDP-4-dehydrorhamnose 3,5-epimerase [Massilia solisilvae]